MLVPVTLPSLGESVGEGTVTRWLKNVGDHVEADEPLLEVSTDKVDTEIPAPVSGTLASVEVAEDATAEVGAALGVIDQDEAGAAVVADAQAPPPPAAVAPVPAPAWVPAPVAPPAPAAAASNSVPAAAPVPSHGSALRGRTVPMSRMRKVIADNMVRALHTSAQLTTVIEADVTGIMLLRSRAREPFTAREGIGLSPMPFFVRATAETLKANPALNASIDSHEDTITYHDAEHIGIAVDTPGGLMVPVLHDAGGLDVTRIARRTADLAARTRDGKITPDELSGATFTITNTGSRGALFDTPVFTPPQVAILGIGATVRRPVVREDSELGSMIAVRDMVYLSLSYDHRVIDGADAARFLTALKARLETARFEDELGSLPGLEA